VIIIKRVKITKKKPARLHECNLFLVNGCEMYCKEYVKNTKWYGCNHRKKLCESIELSVYWLLNKQGD